MGWDQACMALVEKENQGEGLFKQIQEIYDGFLCAQHAIFFNFFFC